MTRETKYKSMIFSKILQTENHSEEAELQSHESIKRKSLIQGTKLQQKMYSYEANNKYEICKLRRKPDFSLAKMRTRAQTGLGATAQNQDQLGKHRLYRHTWGDREQVETIRAGQSGKTQEGRTNYLTEEQDFKILQEYRHHRKMWFRAFPNTSPNKC